MAKTIGNLFLVLLLLAMLTNGSINPGPAVATILRIFSAAIAAAVDDDNNTVINITTPNPERPADEGGYQP